MDIFAPKSVFPSTWNFGMIPLEVL